MKTLLLVCLALFGTTVLASYSEMNALNQSKTTGSFFLSSDRNVFRNPALLEQAGDKVYLETAGEMGRFYDDFMLAVGRKVDGNSSIDAAYSDIDLIGLDFAVGGYVQPFNGKGIAGAGVTIGMEMEGMELYVGALDLTKSVGFKFGTVLPFKDVWGVDEFTLYGEYTEDDVDNLVLGGALEKAIVDKSTFIFCDMNYNHVDKKDMLALTVGGKKMLSESFVVTASGKKELYFGKAFRLGAGVDYYATKDIKIGLGLAGSALDLVSPKYKDFDVNMGVSFAI